MNNDIRFVRPSWEHEVPVLDYIAELEDSGETLESSAGMLIFDSYAEWLTKLERALKIPSITFLALCGERLVGILDVRPVTRNRQLAERAGQVGYTVRKSERGRGYAKQMLKFALEELGKQGLDQAIILAQAENTASIKVIEAAGGQLVEESTRDGRQICKYAVILK